MAATSIVRLAIDTATGDAAARFKQDRKLWSDRDGLAVVPTQTVQPHAPLALRPCAKVSQDTAGT